MIKNNKKRANDLGEEYGEAMALASELKDIIAGWHYLSESEIEDLVEEYDVPADSLLPSVEEDYNLVLEALSEMESRGDAGEFVTSWAVFSKEEDEFLHVGLESDQEALEYLLKAEDAGYGGLEIVEVEHEGERLHSKRRQNMKGDSDPTVYQVELEDENGDDVLDNPEVFDSLSEAESWAETEASRNAEVFSYAIFSYEPQPADAWSPVSGTYQFEKRVGIKNSKKKGNMKRNRHNEGWPQRVYRLEIEDSNGDPVNFYPEIFNTFEEAEERGRSQAKFFKEAYQLSIDSYEYDHAGGDIEEPITGTYQTESIIKLNSKRRSNMKLNSKRRSNMKLNSKRRSNMKLNSKRRSNMKRLNNFGDYGNLYIIAKDKNGEDLNQWEGFDSLPQAIGFAQGVRRHDIDEYLDPEDLEDMGSTGIIDYVEVWNDNEKLETVRVNSKRRINMRRLNDGGYTVSVYSSENKIIELANDISEGEAYNIFEAYNLGDPVDPSEGGGVIKLVKLYGPESIDEPIEVKKNEGRSNRINNQKLNEAVMEKGYMDKRQNSWKSSRLNDKVVKAWDVVFFESGGTTATEDYIEGQEYSNFENLKDDVERRVLNDPNLENAIIYEGTVEIDDSGGFGEETRSEQKWVFDPTN